MLAGTSCRQTGTVPAVSTAVVLTSSSNIERMRTPLDLLLATSMVAPVTGQTPQPAAPIRGRPSAETFRSMRRFAPAPWPTACGSSSAETIGPAKRIALRLAVKAGLARRGRRPAGARAPHRAHGLQRQRRTSSRASWSRTSNRSARGSDRTSTPTPASMRRCTCSTCRPTRRKWSPRGSPALADFAGGLTLDPEEIDKERGVVIEEWRGRLGARLPHSRQADSGALLQVALRRSPADRQARDPPQCSGGAAARLLRHLVSARAHGSGRGRRHRCAARIEAASAPRSARCATARRRRRCRCGTIPLHTQVAGRRSSATPNHTVVGSAGAQTAARRP